MNNKSIILVIVILALIIVLLSGILIFWPKTKTSNRAITATPIPSGIEVTSPKPNDVISSPLKITGLVHGDGWNGFEGQVGIVDLIDNGGNQLTYGILKGTTEWTTSPTNFETTLEFSPVPGTSGSLVFKNENPSGDPVRDKIFIVPITFK